MPNEYRTPTDEEARTLKAERERIVAPTATPAELIQLLPRSADETVILGGPPPSFAWLVVKSGPRAGVLFRLNPKGSNIGRDSTLNDFILDDSALSRQHARLRVEKNDEGEEQHFIYDLATANGTFVNGEQIVKQGLVDGDEILIGQTTLVFKQL